MDCLYQPECWDWSARCSCDVETRKTTAAGLLLAPQVQSLCAQLGRNGRGWETTSWRKAEDSTVSLVAAGGTAVVVAGGVKNNGSDDVAAASGYKSLRDACSPGPHCDGTPRSRDHTPRNVSGSCRLVALTTAQTVSVLLAVCDQSPGQVLLHWPHCWRSGEAHWLTIQERGTVVENHRPVSAVLHWATMKTRNCFYLLWMTRKDCCDAWFDLETRADYSGAQH